MTQSGSKIPLDRMHEGCSDRGVLKNQTTSLLLQNGSLALLGGLLLLLGLATY